MAVSTIPNPLADIFKTREYTLQYTDMAANSNKNVMLSEMTGNAPPSGYVPFALRAANSGNVNILIRNINIIGAVSGSSLTVLSFKNTGSSAASGTMYLNLIYIKSGLLS